MMSLNDAAMVNNPYNVFYISLLEFDELFISSVEEDEYIVLRRILTGGANMLWVTRPRMGHEQPSFAIIDGLARVLRTENLNLALVTIVLENKESGRCVESIMTVYEATLAKLNNRSFESEYVERNGLLHTNRIIEAHKLDDHISSQLSPMQIKSQSFGQRRPLALNVAFPGLLDSLQRIEDEQHVKLIAPHEIEIQVMAIGLNFMDLLVALGRLDREMGVECAGIITRAGENTDLEVGTRVVMTYHGAFKTYARSPYQCVVPIPNTMSFTEAAALPITFNSAYHALHEIARMRKEESILIHSAAGGTGQAAVQLAKELRAEIYATVGSDKKKS